MTTTLLIALLGCTTPLDPADGLVGEGVATPFPSWELVDDDGHLALPADLLPVPVDGTALPVAEMAWREGFSPVQIATLRLPGISASALPTKVAPTPGEGAVRLLDVTSGTWLPCMAELDAADTSDAPTLLVRPLVVAESGHELAVFVTTEAMARPEHFDLIATGAARDVDDLAADTERILTAGEAAGLVPDDVAVAWSYPVANAGITLKSALALATPAGAPEWSRVRRADADDELPARTFATAEGFVLTNSVLIDDTSPALQADGSVVDSGETHRAYVWISVPSSVSDAPAGTVPVLLFGHGIFGHPRGYLDTDDKQQVQRLADEIGAIVVALSWHGMASADRVQALQVAGDFGKLPQVPGRMIQGQLAWRSVLAAIESGELLSAAELHGESGQVLADPSTILYYGISLGGIEGQVLVANTPAVDRAVFHVPGGMWSSMLERSSQWYPFDIVINDTVPEPADRQLLYAASQLWWDWVDPATYVDDLAGRRFILQEATGDEQVPNFTTRVLARSMAVPVLEPTVDQPWGLQGSDGQSAEAVLAQFDPELGIPEDVNRPASNSGAHSEIRTWPGTLQQAVGLLRDDTIGHYCGDAACSDGNRGVDSSAR